ncbi:MAG: manganese efflux pump MntP family protein [Oscillospiraceae bacterium]
MGFIISAAIIGLGLSMDAFAASVSNGICQNKSGFKSAFISALSFGLFQGIMPVIGWSLGVRFSKSIESIDHWVAFALLTFIGINMIRETFKNSGDTICNNFKTLILVSVATSIDALIVGVSFAFSGTTELFETLISCLIIALITFFMCIAGFYIGRFFGSRWKKSAGIAGGIILIAMGVKIVIEHLL